MKMMAEKNLNKSYLPLMWKVFSLIGAEALASFAGFLLGFPQAVLEFLGISALLELVVIVSMGSWRLFKKSGLSGWKSLIPIYNVYCIVMLITNNSASFWGVPFLYLVYRFPTALVGIPSSFPLISFLNLIFLLLALAVYTAIVRRFSAKFHHGWGYTLGLLFFPMLFVPHLGLGKDMPEKFSSRQSQKREVPTSMDDPLWTDMVAAWEEENQREMTEKQRRMFIAEQQRIMQQQIDEQLQQQIMNDQQQMAQHQAMADNAWMHQQSFNDSMTPPPPPPPMF